MRKWLVVPIMLGLLLHTTSYAGSISRCGNLVNNGDVFEISMQNFPVGTFVASGTWTGTVQVEGALDRINYFSLNAIPLASGGPITSFTANGQWSTNTVV